MKHSILFLALFLGIHYAMAGDPSEEGIPLSPVSVYSGGIGAGAMFALNDELSEESEQFLKLAFLNSIHVKKNVNLFMDVNWFAPGSNFGMDLGLDFLMGSSGIRPFMGMGVGVHHFDKQGEDFGHSLGASATVHIGFLLDMSDRLQIQVRVPYHFTANDARDHSIGLDIGFLLSDKFRNTKRLNY